MAEDRVGAEAAAALLSALIQVPSVTPEPAGIWDLVRPRLEALGFACRILTYNRDPARSPPVENLLAVRPGPRPWLGFCGHLDVVPPGDLARWSRPPFSGAIADGAVWGRGAVDMKGAVAAWLTALDLEQQQAQAKTERPGAVVMLTLDEEGPAVNGIEPLLQQMAAEGLIPDACIVGEPTAPEQVGEMIKTGRRGSVSALLTVRGIQGHVAYPETVDNPCHRLARILARLVDRVWDQPVPPFPASSFQVTSIDVGNPAGNVVPAEARAQMNWRFGPGLTAAAIETILREICEAEAPGRVAITLEASAEPFLTEPGPLTALVVSAVEAATGRVPVQATTGGTSDARFVARHCPVVEVGGVGRTMHQVDEHARITDLALMLRIYRQILRRAEALPASTGEG